MLVADTAGYGAAIWRDLGRMRGTELVIWINETCSDSSIWQVLSFRDVCTTYINSLGAL
jgi:hypothetical protein